MTDYLGHEGPLVPADAVAALIVLDDGRYLMQLRDQMPGIFYPGHWGLFGGAIEPGEAPESALRRELQEELDLRVTRARLASEFTFTVTERGRIVRYFYEVPYPASGLERLRLREGREMGAFRASDILTRPRLVPYDAFAIWMHAHGLLAPRMPGEPAC